jgi:hypothetical protein
MVAGEDGFRRHAGFDETMFDRSEVVSGGSSRTRRGGYRNREALRSGSRDFPSNQATTGVNWKGGELEG